MATPKAGRGTDCLRHVAPLPGEAGALAAGSKLSCESRSQQKASHRTLAAGGVGICISSDRCLGCESFPAPARASNALQPSRASRSPWSEPLRGSP